MCDICLVDATGDLIDGNFYVAILAGGSGKRLWPLSRQNVPKQFISLDGNKTLLENTIERVLPLVEPKNLLIVTTKMHEERVQKLVDSTGYRILTEPSSRNTAAAVLFTVMKLLEENHEATICFVPSDHSIQNNQSFTSLLAYASRCADQYNKIIMLGVKPTFASTGYGYINVVSKISQQLCEIQSFHEKPNAKVAQEYIHSETMLWNTGILCAKAKVLLAEFNKHAPNIVQAMESFFDGACIYEEIPCISIDKALLEKTDTLAVVPACFAWSDIGSLEAFIAASCIIGGNASKIVHYNSYDNVVKATNKLVVLKNVQGLCIIETDDVLFITQRIDEHGDVIDYLKNSGHEHYL